ncbi:MAG: hypothetical protein IPJ65_19075 [Archangiaceae bacterium]|nr:hypothetical protein [Archangiaceae bacterium]
MPHDPLKDTRTDASVDAARKALDELFDRASRSLEGQIRRAEEAEPEESVDEAEANERKGTLEYQGDHLVLARRSAQGARRAAAAA